MHRHLLFLPLILLLTTVPLHSRLIPVPGDPPQIQKVTSASLKDNPWCGNRNISPTVPGCTVEVYATVDKPVMIDFDESGYLYIGYDENYTGPELQIYRVSPGATRIEWYGSNVMWDPDAIAYDEEGIISGTPGSVIVGSGYPGTIFAILPDQNVITLFDAGVTNPADMDFDGSGRLLYIDCSARGLYETSGGSPTLLFKTLIESCNLAVDSLDRIFIGGSGTIQIYDSDGELINDSFATGWGSAAFFPIAFGRGEYWGTDLYALAEGELIRFDPSGAPTIIGSGFNIGCLDITFGPDHAMYISDPEDSRILRIICEDRVSAGIKIPEDGKIIHGNRTLIMADIVEGEIEEVDNLLFQYRLIPSNIWVDIPPANMNHPNPDFSEPYFIHWDLSGIPSPNVCELRAVVTTVNNEVDAAPRITVVYIR